ncbi:hypothetical protein KPH14_001943 [Odynerus spinipes]|uniref:Uncharacterized protein n=1 Tax=Odynerus spinipes TaxID=1348599 RepID=A0AAD9S108_9HYME|nr:hypothetical protein KPH14_001943 [Odynerus spinipes]
MCHERSHDSVFQDQIEVQIRVLNYEFFIELQPVGITGTPPFLSDTLYIFPRLQSRLTDGTSSSCQIKKGLATLDPFFPFGTNSSRRSTTRHSSSFRSVESAV